MGHSSVAFTLDIYAHVMPGMQPDAAELFMELVRGPDDDEDHEDDTEKTAVKTACEQYASSRPEKRTSNRAKNRLSPGSFLERVTGHRTPVAILGTAIAVSHCDPTEPRTSR